MMAVEVFVNNFQNKNVNLMSDLKIYFNLRGTHEIESRGKMLKKEQYIDWSKFSLVHFTSTLLLEKSQNMAGIFVHGTTA